MERKSGYKTISWALCFCFVVMAIGGLSLLSERGLMESTEAADTGSSPILGLSDGTILDTDNAFLKDIAWSSNGSIAVAVGWSGQDSKGVAYRYEVRTGEWFPITHNDGNELFGVTWCDVTEGGCFIIVGDGTVLGQKSVLYTDGYTGLQWLYGGMGGPCIYGVATNDTGEVVIVGVNGGYVFRSGIGWLSIGFINNEGTYYDVSYSYINNQYYIVGEVEDGNGERGLFYVLPELNVAIISPPDYYDAGEDMFENPLYGVAVRGNRVLIVGENIVDVYDTSEDVFRGRPVPLNHPLEYVFLDAAWAGNDEAYIVGRDFSNNGLFYQYNYGSHRVSEMPNLEGLGRSQHGIAGRKRSPTMFISVGDWGSDSAFKISQTSGFNDIIVNTYFPHIESVAMYEVGSPGELFNSQIDVNADGQQDRVYEIHVNVTHEIPDILDNVELLAWFDHGETGLDSNYPTQNAQNRTTAFRIRWNRFDDAFYWEWPNPDGGQMEIISGAHWNDSYVGPGGEEGFNIYFQFIPGPQMRFAAGNGGSFEPNPDPYNKSAALGTPNTWDVHVRATDIQGGYNNSYDEFGVYRFTSLTVAGLPGSYTASGAPGQTIGLVTGGNTFVNYSSNCDHRLKVYLETNLMGINTGEQILAGNMSVAGGQHDVQQQFAGAGEGHSIYLLGGIGDWNPPRNRYNYTTTSVNTSDEGVPFNEIEWWVDIPMGIPEDSYRTNLIYVLEHDG